MSCSELKSYFVKAVALAVCVGAFSPVVFSQNESDPKADRKAGRLAEFLKIFPQADANGDGTLTMDEVRVFREAQSEKKNRRPAGRKPGIPEPTHPDVKYGPHERNVIDVWLPPQDGDAVKPTPMVVFFHGGGFVGGDKAGFDPRQYLEAGFAAASANYRLVDGSTTLVSESLSDSARAVQFVKSRAKEWNLDKEKFAVSGGSAGAVITLWIGYSDDLAKETDDPVEGESTRVAALLPINGPANLDPKWIREHMGGPHHIHGSMPKMFGADWDTDEGRANILKFSPWEHVTKDDPPTFLIYSTKLTEVPLPANATTGELVHHPFFGKALEAKLTETGVPAKFVHSFDPRNSSALADYLKSQFLQ